MHPLILNSTWEAILTEDYISFGTQPIKIMATSIHYVITSPPLYGYLFLSVSKYKLRSCDMFTQEDILSQNIKYKFHRKPYSYVNDSFQFVVLSPGCKNVTHTFSIVYQPSIEITNEVIFTTKPLIVDEGSTESIDVSHLSIKSKHFSDLFFNITQKPKRGVLQVKTSDALRNATQYFTLAELKNEQVYYRHDNSESREDLFMFEALSSGEENFQFVNQFKIEVILKNDNSPIRAVDKVFNVVVGGERLVTGSDLKYADADVHTTLKEIVYTCRESLNGNFYYVNNRSVKITEFTQYDLNQNKVLFRHKGPEYGKVRLWVTDGHFHVNGVLEIQASAPFIHVHYNKKLIVQQSSLTVLTTEHLSYSTNVFAANSDVLYEIILQPNFGRLIATNTLKVCIYCSRITFFYRLYI